VVGTLPACCALAASGHAAAAPPNSVMLAAFDHSFNYLVGAAGQG